MQVIETDILIVGGGSGGFGAAIRAARAEPRARILLLDGLAQLGGTSTVGGVNNWEPGIAGPGVHYELYARLPANAIGVGKTVHYYSPEEPYGLSNIDPASSYQSSLRRAGLSRADVRRVHFEPNVMAQAIAHARTHAHWRRMQTDYGFDRYRFKNMSPLVGIRESHRLVGRYVLREQDVRAGLLHQPYRDEIIAVADHPLDTHGERKVKGPKLNELAQPYGIPYTCLLPKEYDNLITASRGSSLSHIAASSCRLSRTMMAQGEAAGVASALALRSNGDYAEVAVTDLRQRLGIPAFVQKTIAQWGLSA
jgi:hypothetical protein